MQAMEGGIDTSHVSFVHKFEVDNDPFHQGTKANEYIKKDGNVTFEIEKHEGGLTLFGRRNGEAGLLLLAYHSMDFPMVQPDPAVRRPCIGRSRVGADR